MKLLIDISEEDINAIKIMGLQRTQEEVQKRVDSAIQHGTPLPKGHGRLKDVGKIDEDRIDHDNPIIYLTINGEYIEAVSLDYINNLPTIIEAESEVQNADSD